MQSEMEKYELTSAIITIRKWLDKVELKSTVEQDKKLGHELFDAVRFAIQSERDRIVRELEKDKYKVTADSDERYYNDALDKAISVVKGGENGNTNTKETKSSL